MLTKRGKGEGSFDKVTIERLGRALLSVAGEMALTFAYDYIVV